MSADVDKAIRKHLLGFAMKAFAQLYGRKQLIAHPYVKFLAANLEGVARGQTRRLLVTLPPRHLKTFLASICLAAWILAHRPSAKILLISYGQELADKIAYSIREIVKSGWYRQLFATRIAQKRTKLTDFVTTAGGFVRSVSIEGSVTGLGADFIIVDDPLEIKDCDNLRQLERVNALFDNEISTRLDNPKRGAIIIVAHRLAEDDLVGHVLRQSGWKQIKLPLIAPHSRTYKCDDGYEWHRPKGELLRPDAFSSRDIERLRAMKRPSFETLQQQNPGAVDQLRFKPEHFGFFPVAMLPRGAPIVLSIDPGMRGGLGNSYAVIQSWCPVLDRYVLLDQWREHARYGEFRETARAFIRKYRPSAILVEATGHGTALMSEIRSQPGMQVELITPHEDKVTRLYNHRRLIRDGRIALLEGAPWASDFVSELTRFPYGDFDDQVDALTQFLDWIAQHPHVPTRPARALTAGIGSAGTIFSPAKNTPTMQGRGAVVLRGSRLW